MKEYIDYLYDYFAGICNDIILSKRIAMASQIITIAGGESILEAGHRSNYVYLIITGLVRGFYIDEDGNDITKCFSMKGDWCCSYNYLSNTPCPFFVEATEDTVLAKFEISELNRIKAEYPVLEEKTGELLAKSIMEYSATIC